MFWKIIIDKIFNINISKYDDFEINCNNGDSVRTIAKAWQTDMVQQAMFVKNANPLLSGVSILRNFSSKSDKHQESSQREIKSWPEEDKYSKQVRNKQTTKSHIKEDIKTLRGIHKKFSRSTYVEIKAVDRACDTCLLETDQEEIKAHMKNLQVLQDKCNGHIEEVERLKRENNSLRIELENVYKSCPWKATFYCPDNHDHSHVPKPFEVALEDNYCPGPLKNIDSEMIITMKKCKHEVGNKSILFY